MDESIENRSIPGITAKLLVTLICGWTSIIISILVSYFSLKAEIETQVRDQVGTDKNLQLQLDVIKQACEINRNRNYDQDKEIGELRGQLTSIEIKQDTK